MKNTTFRKKALLSSVAMLLVAFIALGSATFAWFTANPTVTAKGFTANASTGAGLSVLSQSEKDWYTAKGIASVWDYDAKLYVDATDTDGVDSPDAAKSKGTMTFSTPASFDFNAAAPTFYTTTAAVEYAKEAEDISKATTTDAGIGFFKEDIFLKSTVPGQTATVTYASVALERAGNEALSESFRAMLVDSANKVIGVWTLGGKSNDFVTLDNVVKLNGSNFVALTSGAGTTKYYNDDPDAEAEDIEIACDAQGNQKVTLYVWLDGEDDKCMTTNVNPEIEQLISSINVTISTKNLSA